MVNILAVSVVHEGALSSDLQFKCVIGCANTDQLRAVNSRLGNQARNLTVSVNKPARQVLEHHECPSHVLELFVPECKLRELSVTKTMSLQRTYSEA